MPSPAVTLTATLTDPSGNPVQGKIVLTLVNFGSLVPVVANTVTVANLSYTGLANASGQVSIAFWGNYQLNVPNSFYQVQVYGADANGVVNGAANLAGAYQFNTAGSFDLSALAPISAYAGVVVTNPLTAVVTNPNGTQSISTYGLEAPWFGSESTNLAQSGVIRLASSDAITFRNNANLADISLAKNTSDQLTWAGLQVPVVGPAVAYVGGANPTFTGDIGAQINAAYLSFPSTGGTINVLQQTTGYNFSTPIVFNTANKSVVLKGLAPSNVVSGFISGGTVLNFTPTAGPTTLVLTSVDLQVSGVAVYHGTITGGGSNALRGKTFQITGFTNAKNNGYFACTASSTTTLTLSNGQAAAETATSAASTLTTAITYANDGGTAGDGYNPSQYIEGITLINNEGSTANGGTGNATCGLDFTGAGRLSLKNVLISGFGVGAQFVSGTNWNAAWYQTSVIQNNVGVLIYDGQEMFNWFGGALAVNGVGFSFSGRSIPAAQSTFHGISIDSNVTYGIKETAGSLQTLTFVGCHFENFAGGSATTIPHYIYSETASVIIHGGTALDDATSGTPIDYWFSVGYSDVTGALGNFFYLGVYGLLVQPAGRVANLIFRVGGRAFLSGENTNPSAVTALSNSAALGLGFVTNLFQNNAGNTENNMEISGALTVDGGLTSKGTLTLTNGIRGVTPNHQIFTSNGTFTIPTGITAVKATVVGGGGAGGGSTASNMGGGGASGGTGIKWLTGLTPGNTLTVTVGAGGTGASGAAGGGGVASSVASGTQTITTITANGGGGGGSTAVPVYGTPGASAGTGGDLNLGGNPSITGVTSVTGCGAGSVFGGGGAAAGGGSGNVATAYGAGSGGAFVGSTQAGPNGFAGVVIFEWVS